MSGDQIIQPTVTSIAAFDFDGTLTQQDSFFRFISWRRKRSSLALDLALTFPLLLLYAARLIGNERHKMALFARQFTGMSAESFRNHTREFAYTEIPKILRPEAMERLRKHREQGHKVVIVTASFADWIEPWAKIEGVEKVLGSQVEVKSGRLTGRLSGPNCHGAEKARRLLTWAPNRTTYRLYAYGDSRGDRELLASADEAFFRRFS